MEKQLTTEQEARKLELQRELAKTQESLSMVNADLLETLRKLNN